jgi:hypothetical protein
VKMDCWTSQYVARLIAVTLLLPVLLQQKEERVKGQEVLTFCMQVISMYCGINS